jgi:hypothetical protein
LFAFIQNVAFSKENEIKSNKTLNYIFEEHRGIIWTSNLRIENDGHVDRITLKKKSPLIIADYKI